MLMKSKTRDNKLHSIKKIEFVVSAFSNYQRHKLLHNKENYELSSLHRGIINRMVDHVNTQFENIELSFLYNAFTERDISEVTKSLGRKTYADSGGLQMVTTKMGQKLTVEQIEKEKKEVYKNQAEFSDYGFSFDEIPAVKIDEGMFGIGGSVFVKDLCYDYGFKSRNNLIDQYDTFKQMKEENKSTSKIIPIIQGADTETTELYCDGLFKDLPKDFTKYCSGLAIGGVNTTNIYAPTVLINDVSKVKNPVVQKLFKERIHLLGVGSLSKFLGILILIENGLLNTDLLTIDSASSSKGIWFGSFKMFNNKGKIYTAKPGQTYGPMTEKIYRSIWNEYEYILTDLFTDYEDFMKYSEYNKENDIYEKNADRPIEDKMKTIVLTTAYALRDAQNVMECINRVVFKKEHFYNVISLRPDDKKLMCLLEDCKTQEEIDSWISLVQSRKVKDAKPIAENIDAVAKLKRKTLMDF